MDPAAFLNHLLNFLAPALAVAAVLVLGSHALLRQRARPHGWLAPMALHCVLGSATLAAGLALWGQDGRMLTYAALVLACASAQWALLRGWRG